MRLRANSSPRSNKRGSVEAGPIPSACHIHHRTLRAQTSAAPLKRGHAAAGCPAMSVSPRSNKRGSVEAQKRGRRPGAAGSLRAQTSAAPLKPRIRRFAPPSESTLRAQTSAAPLKRAASRPNCRHPPPSPRSNKRGSVEAVVWGEYSTLPRRLSALKQARLR